MNESKFSAILSVLVPPVVGLISSRKEMSEVEAVESFYRSSV